MLPALVLLSGVVLGLPVFLVLLAAVLSSTLLDPSIPDLVIIQRAFAGLDSFPLLAIPLFVLGGELMVQTGVAARIMKLATLVFGHIRGGLALAVVGGCTFFSSISGSAPATVLTVGKLSGKSLVDAGYSRNFMLGLLLSCGGLGIVIPPSIFLIVFGVVTGTSIAQLFYWSLLAGLLFAGVFAVCAIIYARMRGFPVLPRPERAEFVRVLRDALPSLLIPLLVIGGVSSGVTTPTEAGVTVIAYVLLLDAFLYHELDRSKLVRVFRDGALTTAKVMIILSAAAALSWLITASGVAAGLDQWFGGFESKWTFLLVANLVFLVGGMFLDATSLGVIVGPLLVAAGMQYGIPPVAIGVILGVNGAIGMYTPPFGLNLFVAPEVGGGSLESTVRTLIPFYWVSLLALVLVNAMAVLVI